MALSDFYSTFYIYGTLPKKVSFRFSIRWVLTNFTEIFIHVYQVSLILPPPLQRLGSAGPFRFLVRLFIFPWGGVPYVDKICSCANIQPSFYRPFLHGQIYPDCGIHSCGDRQICKMYLDCLPFSCALKMITKMSLIFQRPWSSFSAVIKVKNGENVFSWYGTRQAAY